MGDKTQTNMLRQTVPHTSCSYEKNPISNYYMQWTNSSDDVARLRRGRALELAGRWSSSAMCESASPCRFVMLLLNFSATLPPLGHIWDVMLVRRKKTVSYVTVLCIIIMVHKGTSSSYRSVDWSGFDRAWFSSLFFMRLCVFSLHGAI